MFEFQISNHRILYFQYFKNDTLWEGVSFFNKQQSLCCFIARIISPHEFCSGSAESDVHKSQNGFEEQKKHLKTRTGGLKKGVLANIFLDINLVAQVQHKPCMSREMVLKGEKGV